MDDYLETRIMTASREQLHLMVIDGALRHCNAALIAMQQEDREGSWSSLSEARAHIVELLGGLAPDTNEAIDNTRSLFKFAYRELMLADTEQSSEKIESAMTVLAAHRETWVMLMELLANDQGEAPAETKQPAIQSLSVGA